WTTIEACLNPPAVGESGRGGLEEAWYTHPPFSEPEDAELPEGIGPVACVHVEPAEVRRLPRWLAAKRVPLTFGLGARAICVLRPLLSRGLDRTAPVAVRSADRTAPGAVRVSPRDVVAAVLPDPATIGPRMTGKTCAGVLVTGTGADGAPRATYLYHVVDNAW